MSVLILRAIVILGLPAAKDGRSQWTSAQHDTTRLRDSHLLSRHLGGRQLLSQCLQPRASVMGSMKYALPYPDRKKLLK